jgi:hypothetical protein
MLKNLDQENEEEIVEQSIFGEGQFKEMIKWMTQRQNYELNCQVTGKWNRTNDFFKGRGKILKKFDGKVFPDALYILLNEGNLGKEDILIGRRIIEITPSRNIQLFSRFKKTLDRFVKKEDIYEAPENLNPNIFMIEHAFKKDNQNRNFFRDSEYDRALSWLEAFTKKYEVSCHIEGIIVNEERQIPCIISGIVKSVDNREIFIQL